MKTISKNKPLVKELSYDTVKFYSDLCDLADFYDEDREKVIDLFIYMFSTVAENYDANTFNTKEKSYLN